MLEALLDKYADEGVDDHRGRRGAQGRAARHARHRRSRSCQRFGGTDRLHRKPSASSKTSSTRTHPDRQRPPMSHLHHHQVHPGHHAQGRRRRRRRPAHRPARAGCSSSRSSTTARRSRAARGRATRLADPDAAALAEVGRQDAGRASPATRCSTSSTTSCSRRSRSSTRLDAARPRRRGASCAASSRTPTTT